MTEEQKVWDKLVKLMERFKAEVEPLVARLKELRTVGVGALSDKEKKNLYMREWMKKKRERERAQKAGHAEVGGK